MLELTFTVEAEPVPTPRPRIPKRGAYYSKRYTTWREQIRQAAEHLKEHNFKSPVAVSLYFRSSNWRKQDIDNLVKGVLDSLTSIVWENDNVVTGLYATKGPPEGDDKPGVTIYLFANGTPEGGPA